MLRVNNGTQNPYSYEIKNKNPKIYSDFKSPATDVFSGSKTSLQNKNNEKPSFKGFIDLFVKRDPLVILKEIAKEAHIHSRSLEEAIHREDFKGIIPKDTIIQILEKEQSKAKMNGKKKDFQILIDKVNQDY